MSHRRAASSTSPSRPLDKNVKGAPFYIGQAVQVRRVTDDTAPQTWLGRRGVVKYFEYDCGCGQSYPGDPMIGVRFHNGKLEEFWREELAPVTDARR